MVNLEISTRKTLKAGGKIVAIKNNGLIIEDEKTGEEYVLSYEDFELFLGEDVKITIVNTVKKIVDEEGELYE